jgi:hypothetical protein
MAELNNNILTPEEINQLLSDTGQKEEPTMEQKQTTPAVTPMAANKEKRSFKSASEIKRIISQYSDDDFSNMYAWEVQALMAIIKGKLSPDLLSEKIQNVEMTDMFCILLGEITTVTVTKTKDILIDLLDRETNKKPIAVEIGTAVGKGLGSFSKAFLLGTKEAIKAAKTSGGNTPKANYPKF